MHDRTVAAWSTSQTARWSRRLFRAFWTAAFALMFIIAIGLLAWLALYIWRDVIAMWRALT